MRSLRPSLSRIIGTGLSGALFFGITSVLAQPDLIVTEVHLEAASGDPSHRHVAGQPQRFSATIQNVGDSATPGGVIHGVSFWVAGREANWSDDWEGPLEAGERVTLAATNGPAGSAFWTFTKPGTYHIEAWVDDVDRIQESDEINNRLSTSIEIVSPDSVGPAGFEAWRQEHFTSAQLADPEVSGPEADAAGDGTPNLLKYAVGLDPWTPATARLPQVDEVGDEILLTYTRLQAAPDLDYEVELSHDLIGWEPAGNALETVDRVEQGETETITARLTGGAVDAERTFLRLRVSSRDADGEWIWRSPLPHGVTMHDVTWADNRWVAVGESGSFFTSPDGSDWSRHYVGIDYALHDVAWNGERFAVAATRLAPPGEGPHSGAILTSEDGVSWTRRDAEHQLSRMRGLTWSGSQFVAVGDNGTILTSPEGIQWTKRQAPDRNWVSVAWNGVRFVAVGSGTIVSSEDGVEWVERESLLGLLTDVTWGDDKFVAVGGDSAVTSPDGLNWSSEFKVTAERLRLAGITWGGGRFVAVGTTGGSPFGSVIVTSSNGIQWEDRSPAPETPGTLPLNEIGAGPEGFLAVGDGGQTWRSENGSDWRTDWSSVGYDLLAVIWDAGQFVAVGSAGTARSSDGINWESAAVGTTSTHLYDVTWGDGLYVASGTPGIFTSPDGLTWTQRVQAYQVNAVTWTGEQFVAVGDADVHGTKSVWTSSSGTDWTERSNMDLPLLYGIASNGSRIVAVGGSSELSGLQPDIRTSEDAVSWSSAQLDLTGEDPDGMGHKPARPLRDVVWAEEIGLFVAVGEGYILTSSDGLEWSRRYSPVVVQAVEWNGARFLAVGEDRAAESSDGIEWQETERLPGPVEDVAFGAGRWVAVGNDHTILTRESQE